MFSGEDRGEAEAGWFGTAQRVSDSTRTDANTGGRKRRRLDGEEEAEKKQKNKMRVTAITEAALRSSRRACRVSPRLHVADSGVRLDKIRSGCLFTPWYRDISPPPLPSPNTLE